MRVLKILLVVAMAIGFAQGCALSPRNSTSLGLSQVLEPVKDSLVATEKQPLVFPAIVGILMVPSENTRMTPTSTLRFAAEELKNELLKNEKYIKGVTIVSASDFREKVSLQKLRDMYGFDIVAVISYEQDQRSIQNGFSSLMDLAIVPAFVVPSVKIITSSVVDGKVVHIPSNAIIFRASGIDKRSKYMTSVSSQGAGANEESIKGLAAAVNDFGNNVSKILAGLDNYDFAKAVSMNDAIEASSGVPSNSINDVEGNSWDKVDAYKRSGGALGIPELLALAFCLAGFARRKRH